MSSVLCVISSSVVMNFSVEGVQLTQYVDVDKRRDDDGKTSTISYGQLTHEFFDSAIICQLNSSTSKALKEGTLMIDPEGFDAQQMQLEIDAIRAFAGNLETLLKKGQANYLAHDFSRVRDKNNIPS